MSFCQFTGYVLFILFYICVGCQNSLEMFIIE